jgi:Cu/Ag efflux pump CusA
MRLPDTSIRRPVFAVMLIGGMVLLGIICIPRLGLDLWPRVEFPIVTVTTVLEGAAPETVERELSQVLEESINTIEGIRTLRSFSSDSLSLLFIEFELEYNIEVKAQEVRDKVAAVRADLPRDIDPPVVDRVDPDSAPILGSSAAWIRTRCPSSPRCWRGRTPFARSASLRTSGSSRAWNASPVSAASNWWATGRARSASGSIPSS